MATPSKEEEDKLPDESDDNHRKADSGDISSEVFAPQGNSASGGKDASKDLQSYQDSPLSKSMDFMFETKYVMLNFMSLVPHEMYSGHVSSSLESASPDLSPCRSPVKRLISKSKSFDISLHARRPRLKHIGRLRSRLMDIESPSSDDNITNRYHWHQLDSPEEPRFDSDPGSQLQHSPWEFDHSTVQNTCTQPGQLSPRKPLYLARSQSSIVSSSGDLSYMSDADDERDDLSNASSIFSSQSIHNRDGFLDLRKSVHILPRLSSQSEDGDGEATDSVDGNILDDGKQLDNDTQTSCDMSSNNVLNECDSIEEHQAMATEVPECCQRPIADRSKLKLNIVTPCEPLQLDDILLSLQTELSSEIDDLESEFEEALKSARASVTPLTPQSEAARVLARIGDEVKSQYGSQLSAAVSRLTYEQVNSLSYEQFRDIALTIVDYELPGWRQVALLMVFGQKVVWSAVQSGQKQFGGIIDLCSRLVADVAADFIIKQGGWCSVMNFDPSQSSDTVSSAELDVTDTQDFFSSHNVTQVDSHDVAAAFSDGNQTSDDTRDMTNEHTNGIDQKKSSEINENSATETKYVPCSFDTHNAASNQCDIEQGTGEFDINGDTFTVKLEDKSERTGSNDADADNKTVDAKSDNAEADKTGVTLGLSGNKMRYASSVGFEVDELSEYIDLTGDMDGDTSVLFVQSPDDSKDQTENTGDSNGIRENGFSNDTYDGTSSNEFSFMFDRHEANEVNVPIAQSDKVDATKDLNSGGSGDNEEQQVVLENEGCKKEDIPIVLYDSNLFANSGNTNCNNGSIENCVNDSSLITCQNTVTVPSPNTNEYTNSDSNHLVEGETGIPSDLSEENTSSIQNNETHDSPREKTQNELISNQREVTMEDSSDETNAASSSANSSNNLLQHLSHRGFQVSFLTLAALAVAVGVKIASK